MNKLWAAANYVTSTSKALWEHVPDSESVFKVARDVTSIGLLYCLPCGTALASLGIYNKFYNKHPIILFGKTVPFTGVSSALPGDPKKPLSDLAHKIYRLKVNQPEHELWAPVAQIQQEASPTVPDVNAPIMVDEEPTQALGANPQQQQVDWEERTQANRDKLVENSANYTTIFFLHVNRLGFDSDDDLLMQASKEASTVGPDGVKPSLWSVYMKYFGKDLNFFQKIYCGFWYVLSHSTGLIANSIDTFLTNITNEFQAQLVDKDREAHMEILFGKVLGQMSSFLDVYNGAMREYAEATVPNGDSKAYRKRAIDTLTGKTLPTLCSEFSETIVNQFFPKVPFFQTLKESKWFGWLYTPLDFLIGTPLNWVGRKIVKYLMPDAVQKIVETGVKATDPTNLPFSIAITNTITELFLDLSGKPVENAPTEELPGTTQLSSVVDKLLVTLDLTGTEDTQTALRKEFAKIDGKEGRGFIGFRDSLIGTRDEIQTGVVRAIQTLFKHLAEDKEATQKLLSDLLHLLNIAFDQSAPVGRSDRLNEYIQAKEGLENAAGSFFEKIVRAGVTEKVRGQSDIQQLLEEAHNKQKPVAQSCFNELFEIAEQIDSLLTPASPSSILVPIDHAVEVLRRFSSQVQQLKPDALPKPARDGFYRSFYPIYRKAEKLADTLIVMQDLQVKYLNEADLEKEFQVVLEELEQIKRAPEFALPTVDLLNGHLARIKERLPLDAAENETFRRLKEKLAVQLLPVTQEELALNRIQTLSGFLKLRYQALKSPHQDFNFKRSSLAIRLALADLAKEEQARITPLLEELQSFPSNVDDISARITELLVELEDTHDRKKNEHLRLANGTLSQFISWTQRHQNSHKGFKQEQLALLQQEAAHFRTQVEIIQTEISQTKPEKQHHPLQYVPEGAINWVADTLGLKSAIMDKFRSAYKLITSSDIYDASARILMHEVIESY